MTEIIANIRYDSLIIFDEPETHLHPNAISQLINSIHSLADQFKSYCIIAPHSPIIVQGILSKNIFVIKNENKVLLLLEWLGEMLVTCLSLIFSDFNINKISNWSSILLIAFIIMILYEIYWIRYFKSNKTMKDMYSSLLGIPVAGATLPVVAFLLLGIYGRNIFLIISTIVLGIGHIGIHLNHKKELE